MLVRIKSFFLFMLATAYIRIPWDSKLLTLWLAEWTQTPKITCHKMHDSFVHIWLCLNAWIIHTGGEMIPLMFDTDKVIHILPLTEIVIPLNQIALGPGALVSQHISITCKLNLISSNFVWFVYGNWVGRKIYTPWYLQWVYTVLCMKSLRTKFR